jgi:hypothetical protein
MTLCQPTSDKLPRMRPLLEDRTPVQLLWVIAASNALTSLGFAIPFVQSWQTPPHHRTPFLQEIPWFFAILAGLIATFLSEQSLREGIASEQWSEALLAAPRRLLEHPAFSFLGWSLIVASFAAIAFTRGSGIAGVWMFIAPSLSLSRVRSLLRPRNHANADSQLRTPAKPLQSEHWGTPPGPFTN